MRNWWWTEYELILNWWLTDDEPMMNSWILWWTDSELMMNWWWSDEVHLAILNVCCQKVKSLHLPSLRKTLCLTQLGRWRWPRKLFQPETESGLMCTRRKVGARGLGEFQQSFWTEQFVIIWAVFCIIVTSLWNIIPCAYDGLSLFLSAIANLWIIWIVWWETNKRNQVAVKWYNWLGWSFY